MFQNKALKAKKSLGQNFLKSEKALQTIIRAAALKKNEAVLEIGPGQGALTEKLLATGAAVLAVEKDRRLIELLKEKFAKELDKKFWLINDDILDIDFKEKTGRNSETDSHSEIYQSFFKKKYKLVANIPYYITGAIIRKFLSEAKQPSRMVLLTQKEVAERIVAKDGKESLLSISVKVYCQPQYIETVKAGSFAPAPSVDSAIILFDRISKKNFTENKIGEELFFKVLNAGFAHKRKMLLGNLKNRDFAQANFEKIFAQLKLDKKIRAENLKAEDWLKITKLIS